MKEQDYAEARAIARQCRFCCRALEYVTEVMCREITNND